MNKEKIENFERGKKVALVFGGLVYLGVVLLFLSFYESLMADQFEGLLGTVARIGAFLVALNSIALPLALHFWTQEYSHRAAGIVFYCLDIILMILNVIAAASSTGADTPAWVESYKVYAPASIVVVLAGWAVLFMFDPGQKALGDLQKAIVKAQVDIIGVMTRYIQSDKGQTEIVAPFAQKLAQEVLSENNLIGTNSLSNTITATPVATPPAQSQVVSQPATPPTASNVEEMLVSYLEGLGNNGHSRELAQQVIQGLATNPTNANSLKK